MAAQTSPGQENGILPSARKERESAYLWIACLSNGQLQKPPNWSFWLFQVSPPESNL